VSLCERGSDSSFDKMKEYDERRKQISSGRNEEIYTYLT
jgi:hypothetical protein